MRQCYLGIFYINESNYLFWIIVAGTGDVYASLDAKECNHEPNA